jgi:flagellar biosynthesis/type III secretory pathway M-ring protein FliF/YscJ
MSAMYHQQSLAQTWKRRQRRQRILVAVVIIVLLAALLYGWLYVFGVFHRLPYAPHSARSIINP